MLDVSKLPSPLWVLGTDTGVGKTYISSFIAHQWAKDAPVVYRKPFQTGVASDSDPEADATAVLGVNSLPQTNIITETGMVLKAPLSPLAAAELEGKPITLAMLDEMLTWCHRPVPKGVKLILEPAGGVMVPLADGIPFIKWASDLEIPAIVVARGGLGTLNHVLLTCNALAAYRWKNEGVVLNPGLDDSFEAARGNADILRRFLDVPVYVHAPRP